MGSPELLCDSPMGTLGPNGPRDIPGIQPCGLDISSWTDIWALRITSSGINQGQWARIWYHVGTSTMQHRNPRMPWEDGVYSLVMIIQAKMNFRAKCMPLLDDLAHTSPCIWTIHWPQGNPIANELQSKLVYKPSKQVQRVQYYW